MESGGTAVQETLPVLDVHPPHEPLHGWRDFFIHLTTITIGLLIALSLEGCVEWQHHRNLVHEAEASLGAEIRSNAHGLQATLDDVHKQQETLKQDVAVLKKIIANPKVQNNDSMSIDFHISGFEAVSWKTAQSTGALSYMPYDRARDYADIYSQQELVEATEKQAARDAIVSIAPFANEKKGDPNPSAEEATMIKQHIEILQGQLLLVEAVITNLNTNYKKFLAAHPE